MRQEITDYILNNRIINEYFSKVDAFKDDFKQHIYLILLELYQTNPNKIEEILGQDLYKKVQDILTNTNKMNQNEIVEVLFDKDSDSMMDSTNITY